MFLTIDYDEPKKFKERKTKVMCVKHNGGKCSIRILRDDFKNLKILAKKFSDLFSRNIKHYEIIEYAGLFLPNMHLKDAVRSFMNYQEEDQEKIIKSFLFKDI